MIFEVIIKKILWGKQDSFIVIFNNSTDKQNLLVLNQANKYKDRLITGISHEFKTPLNGILGILDICLAKTMDKSLVDDLKRCIGCAKQQLYFINSIIDFNEAKANRAKTVVSYFDLDEVFNELREIFFFQGKFKNIDFLIEYTGKSRKIFLENDKFKLIAILNILCTNAFKFTNKGRISLTVREEKNKCLEFSVTDTGIGIK